MGSELMASAKGSRNTASFEIPDPLPRMVSEVDVSLVSEIAEALPPGSVAVELGPWLGGLSTAIAPHAELHAVDSFQWTKDHAKRVPGLLKPEDSFRSVLEQVLRDRGMTAELHESAFDTFVWTGGKIGLLVIDGPKTARDLADCLRPVLASLAPEAPVLIKNALNPKYFEPAAFLQRLIHRDVLKLTGRPVTTPANMLLLAAGSDVANTDALADAAAVATPVGPDFHDSAGLGTEHPYRIAAPLHYVGVHDFGAAYDELSHMKPDRRLRKVWEKHRPRPEKPGPETVFADVFAIHHAAVARTLPEAFHSSPERLLRGAWLNMAEHPDRGKRFQPDLFARALTFGYMKWPSRMRAAAYGKDVLDVGCGPGLHGLGYLAAGATSYLGVDPIIRTDRDRVKNLASGEKTQFGWTPDEVAARLPAWNVLPIDIADLPEGRSFDLAVLHNVTEHLHDLEGAFAEIARVLRPGGHIIYNHDNYYSWNGHHCPPKRVADFDPSDPAQLELVDWGHIEFDPPPGHYIARGLNRVRLDDLIALTERYFTIVQKEEFPSTSKTGIDRLTDDIRARHLDYSRRDLTIKNLLCVAQKS